MTLDQIEVFNIVVTTGSFRAASEKLHRVQSAVSYSVGKLEEELGFELFTRSAWKVTLSPQGKEFHLKSLSLLQESRNLELFGRRLKSFPFHELSICKSLVVPDGLVSEVLRKILNLDQSIFLRVTTKKSSDILEELIKSQFQIALTDWSHNEPSLLSVRLADLSMLPVIHESFNEKDRGRPPRIVLNPAPEFGEGRLRQTPGDSGFVRVDSLGLKESLIQSGAGWGYLPVLSGQEPRKGLKQVPGQQIYPKTIYLTASRPVVQASEVVATLFKSV